MKKILLIAGIIFISSRMYAQVELYNTGILYMSTDADTLFINGNFTNTVTTTLTNNGVLLVKQDITNNQAAMAAGSGTLYLNGTVAQTVSGSQTFKTYKLVTDNAAGITLNNNLSVSNVHTYMAGLITTSATPNYMVYEAGASYTGSNDSRHVNGWVKKNGSTNFIFPVGTATYERAIALTNLTTTAEFDVKHNPAVTPNRLSLYNPLVYVDTSEYWTINKISGAAAQIDMNWDNSKIRFPNLMVSQIKVAHYDGTFWRSIGGSATGNALTTGNITSNSVSAFNRNFTFGSLAYTLPVKIISFTAVRMNNYTKLNWAASSESDVQNYELQRSDDGIIFYTVYTHKPFNRNGTEFYSYDDSKILNGTAFYRLKINGVGGKVNYSSIVSACSNTTGKDFYVITNPVSSGIDVYAGAEIKGLYNFTITNTAGQVVQAGILDIKNAGAYSIFMKPSIVAGAYILVVQNETNKLQKMIVKK